MKKILCFLILFLCVNLQAQTKYWVSFKDKANSTFSIDKPEAFLSKNAIERRAKHNIPIVISDLPVTKSYLNSIQNLGAEIGKNSKWLNGSLVYLNDENLVSQIEALPFVLSVKKLDSDFPPKNINKFANEELEFATFKNNSFDYGSSQNQIEMLKGDFLHNLGFTGSNVEIAIMDNGFPSVDTNIFYQDAFLDGRIIPVYNFVHNNDTLFSDKNGNHGNYVISTMVSFKEGKVIGTAPGATYYLFSTEDDLHEGLAEEYNWAMAAEMADSIMGTNAIISTSLGYSDGFDNSADDHVYADMDGNTTPITKAADLAASKGFLVVVSAGNEGDRPWKYISAPSDGDSVLCVGAVKPDGTMAAFSSFGPNANGKMKPNICAQGNPAAGVSQNGFATSISGTSFSCPIISGMAACLWQAYPNKSNMEIFDAIEKSSHLYYTPNFSFGYGIPNFEIAFKYLSDEYNSDFVVFPNPIGENLQFFVPKSLESSDFIVTITNSIGAIVLKKEIVAPSRIESIALPTTLSVGTYYVSISKNKSLYKAKFVRN